MYTLCETSVIDYYKHSQWHQPTELIQIYSLPYYISPWYLIILNRSNSSNNATNLIVSCSLGHSIRIIRLQSKSTELLSGLGSVLDQRGKLVMYPHSLLRSVWRGDWPNSQTSSLWTTSFWLSTHESPIVKILSLPLNKLSVLRRFIYLSWMFIVQYTHILWPSNRLSIVSIRR